MKSLKDFIIQEELDDNIFWKIDTFYQNKPDELKSFNGMIDVCRANKGFNSSTIDAYISGNSNLVSKQKQFVDFIEDNIHNDDINKDYSAAMYNIVKTIVNNKTEGIKYTNL